jgi:signal recognition particle receptor subunit beta
MEARVQIPLMIGITHTDCPGAWSMEDVTIALGYAHQKTQPTMMRVNPSQKTSVVQALLTSVEQCNPTKALGCYIKKPIAA